MGERRLGWGGGDGMATGGFGETSTAKQTTKLAVSSETSTVMTTL